MTCASEIFTLISARHTSDTGAGGLYNTTSEAYVPNIFRVGDPNARALAQEKIEIEVIEDETDRFGRDSMEVLVRFHVYSFLLNRYPGMNTGDRNQDAVMDRLRVRFHQWGPGTGTVWSFGELSIGGVVQLPASTERNEFHAVVNARLTAREV